mmetsp:Transcript_19978/g.36268  ORF Transcript_19978/g.36268 Transcript_19978/m.36268 type:complete len:93 (+) Transcript_19978:270-548(+)
MLIYSCCLQNALSQKSRAKKARDFRNSLLYHNHAQISPSYSGITRHRSRDGESVSRTWVSNDSRTSPKKTWPKHESLANKGSSGSEQSEPSW